MSTDDVRSELAADLRRVAARLRSAPPARLERQRDSVHALLQRLADTALGAECRGSSAPPATRPVPRLPDEALGDQLAVLGTELAEAVRGLAGTEPVWAGTARRTLDPVLAELAADLRQVRADL